MTCPFFNSCYREVNFEFRNHFCRENYLECRLYQSIIEDAEELEQNIYKQEQV